HGRKLYADDVHDDLVGVSNVFTATPTINKYIRSAESTTDMQKLPPLRPCEPSTTTAPDSNRSSDAERTINKRLLTTDSMFDLKAIPSPFYGSRETESVGMVNVGKLARRTVFDWQTMNYFD
ncbi:hypothetical protein GCK32_017030, partial [Trichostrongylus colubriformis]